ncbi:hypothetical protein DPMN_150216 [Dreissena polymorpha]|uniref:Uncharacterized protein n=1 Tax=Dreissena polymorpha TaxID=45954 RepID=A0A9D4FE77_DREPO|nr:hypothetical protein DPMN_150216 [Dreissena polymorpha]
MSQRTLADFGISLSAKRKLEIDVNESNDEYESNQKTKNPKAIETPKSRVFQTTWLKQFDWLEFNEKTKRMFCKICCAAGLQNSFTKDGAGMYVTQ